MPRIIYIHVPNCGGSSFGAALRLRFIATQATIQLDQGNPQLTGLDYVQSDYTSRQLQLENLISRGFKMVAGHVQYDPNLHRNAGRAYTYVTVLRDPVTRFVSHFRYLQRRHPNHDRPNQLAAFLRTNEAAHIASQYQFYFAGRKHRDTYDPSAILAEASTNLRHFDVVGDLSAPDAFWRKLERVCRTPLPRLKRNTAPEPTIVPANLRPEIEAICATDIAIYRTALRQSVAA